MSLAGLVPSTPEFLPNPDSRGWIADGIVELAARLGPAASQPRLLTDAGDLGFGASKTPRHLDSLFDMICAVQEVIGQSEVELTLLEVDERGAAPKLGDGYTSLGDSNGKLLHTLRGPDEYLMLFTPAVFKVRELMFAAVARELGRVALDRVGLQPELDAGPDGLLEWEADAIEADASELDNEAPVDPLLRTQIVKCRDQLPRKPALALTARLEAAWGRPDEELAEALDMRINAFLQNFTRARRMLAECLRRAGVELG
jgi:hypothetical protein